MNLKYKLYKKIKTSHFQQLKSHQIPYSASLINDEKVDRSLESVYLDDIIERYGRNENTKIRDVWGEEKIRLFGSQNLQYKNMFSRQVISKLQTIDVDKFRGLNSFKKEREYPIDVNRNYELRYNSMIKYSVNKQNLSTKLFIHKNAIGLFNMASKLKKNKKFNKLCLSESLNLLNEVSKERLIRGKDKSMAKEWFIENRDMSKKILDYKIFSNTVFTDNKGIKFHLTGYIAQKKNIRKLKNFYKRAYNKRVKSKSIYAYKRFELSAAFKFPLDVKRKCNLNAELDLITNVEDSVYYFKPTEHKKKFDDYTIAQKFNAKTLVTGNDTLLNIQIIDTAEKPLIPISIFGNDDNLTKLYSMLFNKIVINALQNRKSGYKYKYPKYRVNKITRTLHTLRFSLRIYKERINLKELSSFRKLKKRFIIKKSSYVAYKNFKRKNEIHHAHTSYSKISNNASLRKRAIKRCKGALITNAPKTLHSLGIYLWPSNYSINSLIRLYWFKHGDEIEDHFEAPYCEMENLTDALVTSIDKKFWTYKDLSAYVAQHALYPLDNIKSYRLKDQLSSYGVALSLVNKQAIIAYKEYVEMRKLKIRYLKYLNMDFIAETSGYYQQTHKMRTYLSGIYSIAGLNRSYFRMDAPNALIGRNFMGWTPLVDAFKRIKSEYTLNHVRRNLNWFNKHHERQIIIGDSWSEKGSQLDEFYKKGGLMDNTEQPFEHKWKWSKVSSWAQKYKFMARQPRLVALYPRFGQKKEDLGKDFISLNYRPRGPAIKKSLTRRDSLYASYWSAKWPWWQHSLKMAWQKRQRESWTNVWVYAVIRSRKIKYHFPFKPEHTKSLFFVSLYNWKNVFKCLYTEKGYLWRDFKWDSNWNCRDYFFPELEEMTIYKKLVKAYKWHQFRLKQANLSDDGYYKHTVLNKFPPLTINKVKVLPVSLYLKDLRKEELSISEWARLKQAHKALTYEEKFDPNYKKNQKKLLKALEDAKLDD